MPAAGMQRRNGTKRVLGLISHVCPGHRRVFLQAETPALVSEGFLPWGSSRSKIEFPWSLKKIIHFHS